jgi:hypothetical protein
VIEGMRELKNENEVLKSKRVQMEERMKSMAARLEKVPFVLSDVPAVQAK